MSVILIPRKHYTQPQGRVTLRGSSLFADEIRSSVLLNGANPFDLADPRASLTLVGGASQEFNGVRLSALGQCIRLSNSLAASTQGTVLVWFSEYGLDQPTSYQMIWGNGASVYCQQNSSAATTHNWASSAVSTKDVRGQNDIGFAFTSGPSGAVFIGGDKYPGAGGVLLPAGAKTIQLGIWQSNASFQFVGVIAAYNFVDRVLSDAEIADWMINPWRVYAADPIRIYSFPTGAISLSINSITASNITQTGARIMLGLTR